MNIIYVVSTLRNIDLNDLCRSRCPGWYLTKEWAIEAVKCNDGDIHECGHYPYCVIEEMAEGMYGFCGEIIWFKWEGGNKTGGYVEIENPLPHICGFGIG